MLKRALLLIALLACAGAAAAQAPNWAEGKNYFRIDPAQPTSTPGKVEVVEVFSYACPACYRFNPIVDKLKASLPANAEMAYVPAGFRPDEDWPVFQRAFYAAQALGVVEKTHDAIYDAVWKDRSLATFDPTTNRPLKPGLDEIAKFYARYGVKPEDFIATANSFAVNAKVKRADALVKAYGVEGTPTIIVNGKWRLDVNSAGGYSQAVDLVRWLVARESAQP
ncbi:MAG: thiol:disulfide interchange protein DsbA/DsbL [Mizugakiibacter sp.]|uniref:thiol:disulfide interchange protein DsbA/DsbL n=1 Tax=Mizugakiibacter sp. TaxID=1972610 RepID=UPI0031BE7AC6|nr:thiol:disulfide interchange protein DsbA/DsbL [Xanthomonadaceae bacterium]